MSFDHLKTFGSLIFFFIFLYFSLFLHFYLDFAHFLTIANLSLQFLIRFVNCNYNEGRFFTSLVFWLIELNQYFMCAPSKLVLLKSLLCLVVIYEFKFGCWLIRSDRHSQSTHNMHFLYFITSLRLFNYLWPYFSCCPCCAPLVSADVWFDCNFSFEHLDRMYRVVEHESDLKKNEFWQVARLTSV